LDRRLDGPQSSSGRGGLEKNSQPPPGIEPQNLDRPARNLVAMSTELSRLLNIKERMNPLIIKFSLSVTVHSITSNLLCVENNLNLQFPTKLSQYSD
jgi:hypothetical protein